MRSSVRRMLESSDDGELHRSTRIGAGGPKRVRTRSHQVHHRGRKIAGQADGRRLGSFCLRALNQHESGRSWQSGMVARSDVSLDAMTVGPGRRSRVDTAARHETSEVVVSQVRLPQPKGAGGHAANASKTKLFEARCTRGPGRSCRGEKPRHLEMGTPRREPTDPTRGIDSAR